MSKCTFEGCERAPRFPDQSRCEEHRLRWVAGQAAQREPEWMRRRRTTGLPVKDFSAA